MGLPGRKPKPTALRVIEGNREHRPIKETVKVPPTLPKTPSHLGGPALTEWKVKIKQMGAIPGWLTALDNAVLAAYCECWETIVTNYNHIKKKGGPAKYMTWCQKNNEQPRHMLELRQARKDIRVLASELGFSPTSRGRIEPSGKPEDIIPDYLD